MFGKFKSKRVGGAATEGMLNPLVGMAKRMGMLPSKERILLGLHKGAFNEICDYVKKHHKLPEVKDVTATLPKSFIKSMAALGVTEDDIENVVAELLKDATVEKFKRYM